MPYSIEFCVVDQKVFVCSCGSMACCCSLDQLPVQNNACALV